MIANRAAAAAEIRDLFDTAWASAGPVQYDNVRVDGIPPDDPSTLWARLMIRHENSFEASLNGPGLRRFRRTGTIQGQIFQPRGTGITGPTDLGTIVRDAFEGVTSPGGIIFRDVSVNEVGPDGDWFQTNIGMLFEYDELK